MKKIFLLCIFSVLAYGEKKEPKACEFLLINPSLRSVACGGAGGGAMGDISGAHLNPASIIGLLDGEIKFIHSELLSDLSYEFIGYGVRFSKGALSLSGCGIHMPKIEGRKVNKEPFDYQAYDIAIIFTLAKETRYGAIGTNVKMFEEVIEEEKKITYGLDLGWLYQKKNVGIGASIANIGPRFRLIEEPFPLPLVFRTGFSFRTNRANIFLDLRNENEVSLHLGTELMLNKFFILRGGISQDEASRFTGGFCIRKGKLLFDYSYVFSEYRKILGDIHHFSLGFILK